MILKTVSNDIFDNYKQQAGKFLLNMEDIQFLAAVEEPPSSICLPLRLRGGGCVEGPGGVTLVNDFIAQHTPYANWNSVRHSGTSSACFLTACIEEYHVRWVNLSPA